MALSADTVWEVRATASNDNGGGFVAGAAGVDYSQQDAAEKSPTDLVIDGSDSSIISSAGAPFDSDDIGNLIQITGGTGFTTGLYEITAVDGGGNATLDRSAGSTSSTGGSGNLGGALKDPGYMASVVVASNTAYVAGAHSITSDSTDVAGGKISQTVARLKIIGYGSTRGDNQRSTWTLSGGGDSGSTRVVDMSDDSLIANIEIIGSSKTPQGALLRQRAQAINCRMEGLSDGFAAAGFSSGMSAFFGCIAFDCTVGYNLSHVASYCVADSCGTGFQQNNGNTEATYAHCIAIDNTNEGFQTSGGDGSHYFNCVADGNGSHGFGQTNCPASLINCIATNNGGYGFQVQQGGTERMIAIINCAHRGNASGGINEVNPASIKLGNTALSADPYSAVGSEDYRLNGTTGGGLELRTGAWPATILGAGNHASVGAVGPSAFGTIASGGRMYPTGRKKILDADIDLLAHDIKAAFVLDTYTFSEADEFLDDVNLATNGESSNLSSKSTTGGVLDAADASATPDTGQDVDAIVLYRDTGDPSTSPLICYIDGFAPLTTNGSAIPLTWDDGDNKIFAIVDAV